MIRLLALALWALAFVVPALAQPSPVGTVSIANAPTVVDIETAAARSQRFFVASTNLNTVANGNFLNVTLCNAAGSGKLVTVTERRFDANLVSGGLPITYGGITAPVLTNPTITSTGSNISVGGPTSSAVTMSAVVANARLNNAAGNAVPTASGFVPANGEPLKLIKPRILPPGQCLGQFITGQNQMATGITASGVSAGLTFYWAEEPVQ